MKGKYLLVKHHDRVGRMADTLEYSDVALPLSPASYPALLEEMDRLAPPVWSATATVWSSATCTSSGAWCPSTST